MLINNHPAMDDFFDIRELRKKAEEELKKNPGDSDWDLSESDKIKLVHELDVYRIELEMQQQELLQAKEQVDKVVNKYNELLDLHNRFILHLVKKDNISDPEP